MTPEQAGDLVMQAVIEGLRRQYPGAIIEVVAPDEQDAQIPAQADEGSEA
jgi:ADP-heptose:LPS heptosyltransferase